MLRHRTRDRLILILFPFGATVTFSILKRRGLHFLCSDIATIDGNFIFLWEFSLEEINSRAMAINRKVNLVSTAITTLQQAHAAHTKNQTHLVERLFLYMRKHNFPKPYSSKDIGEAQMEVLFWLAQNLINPTKGLRSVAPQLCIVGAREYYKTLLLHRLASFLRIFVTSPSFEQFVGADESEVWLIDGAASTLVGKRWARSQAEITFARLLGGERYIRMGTESVIHETLIRAYYCHV